MKDKHQTWGIIPIFVSHLGCPHDCAFCNQKKITGISDAIKPEALEDYVMDYLTTMKRDHIELAFFGGSFTGIEASRQIAYLKVAQELKAKGLIHAIRLSTRPDYMDNQIAERLKEHGVDLVELGVQSFSTAVLKASKRGHDVDAVSEAVEQLKRVGIDFGIQLMLGLPMDSYDQFMVSVKRTIELKPQCVRLYPALVIRGTALEMSYDKGHYAPLELEMAVKWASEAYQLFESAGIPVIRLGLQRTDLIDFDGDVLAGPFHPAFGELVISACYLSAIKCIIDERTSGSEMAYESLIIEVPEKGLSKALGQKRDNLIQLENNYGKTIKSIIIKGTHDVSAPNFRCVFVGTAHREVVWGSILNFEV